MPDFLRARWPEFLAALQAAGRADAELAAFSANADCCFRLMSGERSAEFVFQSSTLSITEKSRGFSPAFVLEAPVVVWEKFFSAVPPAPYHGIYAMKMRVPEFRFAGSELALAQSMHLVRRVLEIGRNVANSIPGSPVSNKSFEKNKKDPIRAGYVWIEYEGRPSRIYFEEAGTGRDLLCLHTAGSDSRQFYKLLNDPGLGAEWRMVAFDLPWHGKSLPPEGAPIGAWDLTTERYVAAIEAMIEALGLRRPVLLGSSMAGQICLEMALRWGERLARIDTKKCPVSMLTGEYDHSCTPEISRASAAKIPGAEFEVMRGIGHFPMAENPELFLEYLRPVLSKLHAR